MSELGVAYVQIVPSFKGMASKISESLSGAAVDKPIEGLGAKIKNGVGGAFKSAAKIGAVGIGVATAALAPFIREALSASDATDKFKSTLKFAGKSASDIDRLSTAAKKYADQTVYGLGDIQGITAQLAANNVKDFDRLAMAAGNLNAVAGGTADTYKSVGMVLTQTAGLGKLTTENWNQLSEAIPGASGRLQEAMLKAGAYTGNFREAMEKGEITAQEFNDALLSLGFEEVAVEAAASTKTFEGAIGNLQATVVGGLAKIIDPLKPALTSGISKVADWLSPVFDRISSMVESFVSGFGKLDFSNMFGGMSPAIGGLLGLFGSLLAQLPVVGGAFAGLTGPVGLAVGAIIGIVSQSKPLQDALMSLLQSFSPLVPFIGSLAGELLPQLGARLGQLGDMLAPLISAVGNLVSAVLPLLMGAIQGLLPLLETWVSATLNMAGPVIGAVTAAVSMLAALLRGDFSGAWTALKDVVSNVWQAIQCLVKSAVDMLVAVISTAWNAIKAVTSAAWNGIKSLIGGALSAVQGVMSNAWNQIKSVARGAWDGFKGIVSAGVTGAVSLVGGLPGKILGVLGNLGSLLVNSGRSMLDGLARGIRNGIGAAVGAAKDALSAVRRLFPFSPAKEGPFSGKGWVLYSGLSIGEALGAGIERSSFRAIGAASSMAERTSRALNVSASIADGVVASRGGGVAGGVVNITQNIAVATVPSVSKLESDASASARLWGAIA